MRITRIPRAGGILAGMLLLSTLASACALPSASQNSSASSTGASKSVTPHNLKPIASNQWYSNIYKAFPTQPMFALPAAYELAPNGLSVSMPDVHKTPDTIFAPYVTDFTAGFAEPLQKPQLTAIGDWSIGVRMATTSGQSLSFTLAHGVPSTVLHASGGPLVLRFTQPVSVYNHNSSVIAPGAQARTTDVAFTTDGHWYLLALPSAQTVSVTQNSITIAQPGRVFLGMLDTRAHYDLFRGSAGAEVVGTQATPTIEQKTVSTTYAVATTGGTPLIALYPHQYDALSTKLPSLGTYSTIRGVLHLVRSNSFVTSIPKLTPSATFPAINNPPAELVSATQSDIQKFLQTPEPGSRDYYLGVWFGHADNLLLLAQMYGLHAQQAALLHDIEPKFAASLRDFQYNPALTSVIATQPEFGNEQLNDHHFHYGYYIRTAAVLARIDPSFLAQIRAGVEPLVHDIGTYDRTSTTFPFLRTFDVYEGHSWADGFANFADGNDQESSSEAIQAWYSLYLWGQVTHDTQLQNEATYLYSTEVQSTLYYWFGQNHLYSAPYNHAIASLVWGGKVDFATWFSPATNMKYGIQILPITPGSTYLGMLPSFAPYAADFQAHGGSVQSDWGDLWLVWESFYHPNQAYSQRNAVPASAFNISRSMFLYMLYAHKQQRG